MPFVPDATANLSKVELAIEFPQTVSQGSLLVNLFADQAGLPGPLLESFTSSQPSTGKGVFSFQSTVHPSLTTGHTYFLEATTTEPASLILLMTGLGYAGWRRAPGSRARRP